AFVLPDPIEPSEKERGRNVVRQVRDDLAGPFAEHCRVDLEGIAGDQIEAPWIGRGYLTKGCQTAPVAFDRDNPACPRCEQRPRQPARTRPDLDDGRLVERARSPCNSVCEVEVEQEILTEAFVRDDPVSRDNLAQWR